MRASRTIYLKHDEHVPVSHNTTFEPTSRRPIARTASVVRDFHRFSRFFICRREAWLLQQPMREVKNMLPKLPDIFVPVSEKRHLSAVAAAASDLKLPVAAFLRAELRRAHFCAQPELPAHTVIMNGRLRYRIDWGSDSSPCRVVYPEDFSGNDNEISLLSPLGVALLGLRAGERMPFFTQDRGFRLLTVAEVEPVIQLRRPGAHGSPNPASQTIPMEVLS
jgi:transcription elongation GreA/GreB family factor